MGWWGENKQSEDRGGVGCGGGGGGENKQTEDRRGAGVKTCNVNLKGFMT